MFLRRSRMRTAVNPRRRSPARLAVKMTGPAENCVARSIGNRVCGKSCQRAGAGATRRLASGPLRSPSGRGRQSTPSSSSRSKANSIASVTVPRRCTRVSFRYASQKAGLASLRRRPRFDWHFITVTAATRNPSRTEGHGWGPSTGHTRRGSVTEVPLTNLLKIAVKSASDRLTGDLCTELFAA